MNSCVFHSFATLSAWLAFERARLLLSVFSRAFAYPPARPPEAVPIALRPWFPLALLLLPQAPALKPVPLRCVCLHYSLLYLFISAFGERKIFMIRPENNHLWQGFQVFLQMNYLTPHVLLFS